MKSFLLLFVFIATLGLVGCEEGPAEQAGEQIDQAADEVGDAVENAGDKVD